MTPDTAGLTAESLAETIAATASQMRDLHHFQRRLSEANQSMNLVGPTAIETFWDRHVLDCAQLLHVEHSALRWADIGAGAGFPGVVLAILLKGRAGATVHLVESMAKKVRFLEALVLELDLPAEVHHTRAEAMAPPADVEIVTARACAPLSRLFDYTIGFFRSGATGLFLKGREIEAELAEARTRWRFSAELLQSQSDVSGRILRVESLTRA